VLNLVQEWFVSCPKRVERESWMRIPENFAPWMHQSGIVGDGFKVNAQSLPVNPKVAQNLNGGAEWI